MTAEAAARAAVAALQRARAPLLVLLALALLASLGLATRVGVDNSVEVWFLEGDPALDRWGRFQADFGNDETVVIALDAPPGGTLLGAAGLQELHALAAAARAVPGIARVEGPTTLASVRATETGIEVGPLFSPDEPPPTAGAATARLPALTDDPTLRRFFSADGSTAVVFAHMEAMDDIDLRRDGVLRALDDALVPWSPRVSTAGIGVIYAGLNDASTRGAAGVLLGSALAVTVLLALRLRRVGAVALSFAIVGAGVVLLVGLMGLLGRDVNMVSMVMPALILVIGTSDAVHLLSAIAAADPALPPTDRARAGVAEVFWPCLLNTLTTAAGFLALLAADMPVLRDLGLLSALSLLLAFGLSVGGAAWFGGHPACVPALRPTDRVQRAVDALGAFALRRPAPVLLGAAFTALVSVIGISRLQADTFSIGFLPPEHRVRVHSDHIEARFGPYTPLEFIVEAPAGVWSPPVLAAIAAWQDRVAADGLARWSRSPADGLRRLDGVLRELPQGEVPADPAAFDQLSFVLRADPGSEGLFSALSADGARARVTFGVPMASARGFARSIADIEARIGDIPGATVSPAGYLPLYVRIMDAVVDGQLQSFAWAFLGIFAIIGLAFRSARIAALAVPSNLLPVLFVLGVMGFAGVPLDVATVTVAAIVLGLVVDDTVQLLWRWRREALAVDDPPLAMRRTLSHVGAPMATTSLVLASGFLVLWAAPVSSVSAFGWLLALALLSAMVADLLVMPALLGRLPAPGRAPAPESP